MYTSQFLSLQWSYSLSELEYQICVRIHFANSTYLAMYVYVCVLTHTYMCVCEFVCVVCLYVCVCVYARVCCVFVQVVCVCCVCTCVCVVCACVRVCVCVIGLAKTGNICTNYKCLEKRTIVDHCFHDMFCKVYLLSNWSIHTVQNFNNSISSLKVTVSWSTKIIHVQICMDQSHI